MFFYSLISTHLHWTIIFSSLSLLYDTRTKQTLPWASASIGPGLTLFFLHLTDPPLTYFPLWIHVLSSSLDGRVLVLFSSRIRESWLLDTIHSSARDQNFPAFPILIVLRFAAKTILPNNCTFFGSRAGAYWVTLTSPKNNLLILTTWYSFRHSLHLRRVQQLRKRSIAIFCII